MNKFILCFALNFLFFSTTIFAVLTDDEILEKSLSNSCCIIDRTDSGHYNLRIVVRHPETNETVSIAKPIKSLSRCGEKAYVHCEDGYEQQALRRGLIVRFNEAFEDPSIRSACSCEGCTYNKKAQNQCCTIS